MHVIKSKLIDVEKSELRPIINIIGSSSGSTSSSSLACRDKKPTWVKNISRYSFVSEKNGIWCYCTRCCLSIRKHWGVCEFLSLVSMLVCLFYFILFVCFCVCVFFTFYRCFAEYEKSKYSTTAISSLLILLVCWLVGWLACWLVVAIYFPFVHISFVFIIYFHNVYTAKTNI